VFGGLAVEFLKRAPERRSEQGSAYLLVAFGSQERHHAVNLAIKRRSTHIARSWATQRGCCRHVACATLMTFDWRWRPRVSRT
jgi:hypothetical protein